MIKWFLARPFGLSKYSIWANYFLIDSIINQLLSSFIPTMLYRELLAAAPCAALAIAETNWWIQLHGEN